MKTNERYYIYDWRKEKWIKVTKKKYNKYQKLLSELHDIMFPKNMAS